MKTLFAILLYTALFVWFFVAGVRDGDMTLVGVSLVGFASLAAFLGLLFSARSSFEPWWTEHRDAIAGGEEIAYGDRARLSGASQIVRFEARMGLLLGEAVIRSPALVVGVDRAWPTQIVYTLVTLLFGFLSFRGLLLAPVTMGKNLARFDSLTLDALVAGIDPSRFAELRPADE